MQMAIGNMISRYGTQMILIHNGEEMSIRAFLQETASRSKGSAQWEMGELGGVPQSVYVYIGPVTPEAVAGDLIYLRKKIYQLRRTQLVMVEDEAMYCWGICVEKGGDGAWGESASVVS